MMLQEREMLTPLRENWNFQLKAKREAQKAEGAPQSRAAGQLLTRLGENAM